mmetsp:Transcript_72182/g.192985  ORF Transcript_72182/g.192985 Transcript_72182/m.192985 type:complete len:603 (-) Transcript_72182:110-1918(-)
MQAAVAKHWLRHERRCFGGGRGQSEANTLLQQLAREPCVCREVSQGGGVMGETSERRQAKDVFEVEVAHEEDDDDQDAADADAAGAEPEAALLARVDDVGRALVRREDGVGGLGRPVGVLELGGPCTEAQARGHRLGLGPRHHLDRELDLALVVALEVVAGPPEVLVVAAPGAAGVAQLEPLCGVLEALLVGLFGVVLALHVHDLHVVGGGLAQVALEALGEHLAQRQQPLRDGLRRLDAEEVVAPDGDAQQEVLGGEGGVRRGVLDALVLDPVVEHGVARLLDAHVRVRLLGARPPSHELGRDSHVGGPPLLGRDLLEVPHDEPHLQRHLSARDVDVLDLDVLRLHHRDGVDEELQLTHRDAGLLGVVQVPHLARLEDGLLAPLLAEPPVLQVDHRLAHVHALAREGVVDLEAHDLERRHVHQPDPDAGRSRQRRLDHGVPVELGVKRRHDVVLVLPVPRRPAEVHADDAVVAADLGDLGRRHLERLEQVHPHLDVRLGEVLIDVGHLVLDALAALEHVHVQVLRLRPFGQLLLRQLLLLVHFDLHLEDAHRLAHLLLHVLDRPPEQRQLVERRIKLVLPIGLQLQRQREVGVLAQEHPLC